MPGKNESKERVLSNEELEKMTQKLYEDSVANRARKLEQLDRKYNKTCEAPTISASQAEASAERQVYSEMERRKKNREQLQRKYYKEEPPKVMTADDVEASIRRMYNDTMQHKQDKLKRLEKKYVPKDLKIGIGKDKTLSKEEEAAMGKRLCVPSKREFTHEEINKILGFS